MPLSDRGLALWPTVMGLVLCITSPELAPPGRPRRCFGARPPHGLPPTTQWRAPCQPRRGPGKQPLAKSAQPFEVMDDERAALVSGTAACETHGEDVRTEGVPRALPDEVQEPLLGGHVRRAQLVGGQAQRPPHHVAACPDQLILPGTHQDGPALQLDLDGLGQGLEQGLGLPVRRPRPLHTTGTQFRDGWEE
jgi:hypothetical protein